MGKSRLLAFLHFGYVPVPDAELPFPAQWIPDEPMDPVPRGHRVEQGSSLLRRAILQSAATDKTNVVPLSGGLDSRAIIAALMEAGRKVAAVTFGIPGTFDFEIGRLVADHVGVPHEVLDLTNVRLTTDALVDTARERLPWTGLVEAFYNRLIPKHFGHGACYIHGFLGETLTGSHVGHPILCGTGRRAVQFIEELRWIPPSLLGGGKRRFAVGESGC